MIVVDSEICNEVRSICNGCVKWTMQADEIFDPQITMFASREEFSNWLDLGSKLSSIVKSVMHAQCCIFSNLLISSKWIEIRFIADAFMLKAHGISIESNEMWDLFLEKVVGNINCALIECDLKRIE